MTDVFLLSTSEIVRGMGERNEIVTLVAKDTVMNRLPVNIIYYIF